MGIYKTNLEWIEKNANHYDVDDIVSILNRYEQNFSDDSAKALKEIRYLLLTSINVNVTRAVAGIFCKYIKVQKYNRDVKNSKGELVDYELELPISDILKHAIARKCEEYKKNCCISENFSIKNEPHRVDLNLDNFEQNKKHYNKKDILTIIYQNKMHCSEIIDALEYLMLKSHNKKFEAFAVNCFKDYAYVKKLTTNRANGKNCYEIDAQMPKEIETFVAKTCFDFKCEEEYFKLSDCTFLQNLR